MALDLAFLKKKAGPLTYGEWALVGSAGLGIAFWIRSRSGGNSAANAANAYDPLGSSYVSPAGSVITGNPSSGAGTSAYTTNAEWGNAAVDALVKAGVAAGTATNAIAHYLNGDVLTGAEQALVSQAIGLIGNPPGGPIAVVTTPTNTSGTTDTTSGNNSGSNDGGYTWTGDSGNTGTGSDTNGSTAGNVGGTVQVGSLYTVRNGDNWINVAQRAGVSEEALLAVNAARGPSALKTGQTIYLPAGASYPAALPSSNSGSSGSGSGGGTGTTTIKIVGYYKVVSGDNWINVAQRAGISESALLAANASRGPSALRGGESLAIPSPGHVPAAKQAVTSPSKGSTTASSSAQYYTVKTGDNWNTVAYAYGMSTSALLNLNSSRGPSALKTGEKLRVR